MNNINTLLAFSFKFDNPLYLLILVPGVILALIPYFRIRKDKRRTRERVVSMILHLVILLLASFVLAGFTIHEDQSLKNDETFILLDVSDSNYDNSENMANYINQVIGDSDAKCKVGIIVFGAGEPHIYKPLQNNLRVNVAELYEFWDNPKKDEEGFIMTTGTDMGSAISFAAKQFTGYKNNDGSTKPLDGCRIVILSDGIETDGNATSAAGQVSSMGAVIDSVYFEPKDYTNTNEVQLESVTVKNKNPKPDQAVEVEILVKAHKPGDGATATFKLYDYNAQNPSSSILINEFTDNLDANEKTFTTSVSFSKGGVHTIKVEMTTSVETEEDLMQNNKYYTYVVVQEKVNKVLIIDGSGTGCADLKSLIEEIKEDPNNPSSPSAYTVDVISQEKAPTDLKNYGEVILVNANSTGTKTGSGSAQTSRLPNGYDLLLKNYAMNGGSVFTMGGQNTYYYGGMGTDNFNDFLPIKVKPESSTTKEVVLLIDRSSGMCGGEGSWGYAQTRLQVVQEAVKKCLAQGVFSKQDYIGVIFFGGKNYTPIEALKLTSASNLLSISNAVNKDITAVANGKNYLGNTEWRHGLEAAAKMLTSSKAGDNDHIIMITDGAGDKAEGESAQLTINGVAYPVGAWKINAAKHNGQSGPAGVPDKCYTDYLLNAYGITTSVINVGCNLSPAKEYMAMMETASDLDKKQHYYYTETPDEIASAIEIECKNIPTKIINEDQDFYLSLQSSDLQKLCADEDLPVLRGYNGATTKDGAGAIIQTATSKDPIYAEWTYKNGKVGSLMTDITTEWGNCLMNQTETRDILKYIIKNNFIGGGSTLTSDMTVEFNQKNFTTNIVIKDINKEGLVPVKDANGNITGELGYIEGYYHSPSDNVDPSKDFANLEDYLNYLCPETATQYETMIYADGQFIGDFQMMEEGLYIVAFLRMDSQGYLLDGFTPPYTYVTFSYSDEYDTYYDKAKSLEVLEDICNSANGQVYYYGVEGTEQNIFSAESQYSSRDIDPVFALMLAALILFILDICARKFHFLLPGEIIRKMRGLPINKEQK